MRVVKHRGNAIKAETIELKLLEPVFAVREQEMQHLVLTIIETERIPCRMLVTIAWVEELIRIASKIAKTFNLVLNSMRMHDIHNNCHTILMSSINKLLQLLWSTKTTTWCKE